jgi:putative chitinase
MTPKQLAAAIGCPLTRANNWVNPLNAAMDRYGINTPARQAAFIAQIGHESALLSVVVESTNYTRADRLLAIYPHDFDSIEDAAKYVKNPEACANRVYANQNGNGPESSGDGWNFRGRGLIQITGRANYASVGRALGLDLEKHPELLAQPVNATMSAAWFWNAHGCNALADQGDFKAITKTINGGFNGLPERLALWRTSKQALDVA